MLLLSVNLHTLLVSYCLNFWGFCCIYVSLVLYFFTLNSNYSHITIKSKLRLQKLKCLDFDLLGFQIATYQFLTVNNIEITLTGKIESTKNPIFRHVDGTALFCIASLEFPSRTLRGASTHAAFITSIYSYLWLVSSSAPAPSSRLRARGRRPPG